MWLSFKLKILMFSFACTFGVLVAFWWRDLQYKNHKQRLNVSSTLHDTSKVYKKWLKDRGFERKRLPEEWRSYKQNSDVIKIESDYLYEQIPVLCIILSRRREGAQSIKETWGKTCNSAIYWGDFADPKIPVLKLQPENSLCEILNHVWLKHADKYKWIFFADCETFAIIENLRHYVAPLESDKPIYLGHPVQRQYFTHPYNLLDAGAVLSLGAFKSLIPLLQSSNCTSLTSPSNFFDQNLGILLQKGLGNNLHVSDTRDVMSRGRFNPFTPEDMIIPGSISVFNSYWRSSLFLSNEGTDCCSDEAISFHGISPIQMHLLKYLIQSLAVFRESLNGFGNAPVTRSYSKQIKIQAKSSFKKGKSIVKLLSKANKKTILNLFEKEIVTSTISNAIESFEDNNTI